MPRRLLLPGLSLINGRRNCPDPVVCPDSVVMNEATWHQIEPLGKHTNAVAGVAQLIDSRAATLIVNRFNAEADNPEFAGMLVDRDHLKCQMDQETRAYGW